ncbi:MAG: CoA-binding protein [Saprospirales bacterium]|nr:MAG: CoA-binding protein [Saprospirales bacterium]
MKSNKMTLVLGASENPSRYSNRAIAALKGSGEEVVAVGKREGSAHGVAITASWPESGTVHSLSMYLNPQNQDELIKKIIELRPRRIIFNPGSENPILEKAAVEAGIECLHACTLVLIATNAY